MGGEEAGDSESGLATDSDFSREVDPATYEDAIVGESGQRGDTWVQRLPGGRDANLNYNKKFEREHRDEDGPVAPAQFVKAVTFQKEQ